MELPENEKIRLIKGISGVFHTPKIIEGKTSSTGKTIKVETDRSTYRLDTEEILSGGLEVRRATTFKLYTPEAYVRQKKSNYDPANGRNLKAFKEDWDLPEATHEAVN
ncbi:hypothetical protein SAMN05443574_103321 [Haloarcula vallismortis]|uniref:Uncharacterized protein n=3 Tax=Haloarcula vallismortis TaxID=28442 RepID=M0JT99_HALVA|nr:hypothetical protein C437_01685 [Haloarcula vallismortis ATCC 29715]SDW45497.1 hypothetical protein SAMN05443574_103321 [Haloarcula vallismortis]